MSVHTGIEVMGVDLEIDQVHAIQAFRLDDGHVVGGPHSWTGHIGTGAPAHIGGALLANFPENFHQLQLMQFVNQMNYAGKLKTLLIMLLKNILKIKDNPLNLILFN